ncbi:protein of unknown function [Pseudomonas sp. JV551A1]|nr:protein of unknown function [Pseudomonas sp. JV551A1]
MTFTEHVCEVSLDNCLLFSNLPNRGAKLSSGVQLHQCRHRAHP